LAGVKFLLKKERVFFFRCSALEVSEQVAGRNADGAKHFLREERICFVPTDFFKTAGFWFPPRRRVREECAVGTFLNFWRLLKRGES
jgi:hypothetical protein